MDNKQFVIGVQFRTYGLNSFAQAGNKLNNLAQNLQKVNLLGNKSGVAFQSLTGQISSTEKSVSRLGIAFRRYVRYLTSAGAIWAGFKAVSTSLESAMNLEIQLERVNKILRLNAAEVKKMNKLAMTAALVTPFNQEEVMEGIKAFAQSGVSAKLILQGITKEGRLASGQLVKLMTDFAFVSGGEINIKQSADTIRRAMQVFGATTSESINKLVNGMTALTNVSAMEYKDWLEALKGLKESPIKYKKYFKLGETEPSLEGQLLGLTAMLRSQLEPGQSGNYVGIAIRRFGKLFKDLENAGLGIGDQTNAAGESMGANLGKGVITGYKKVAQKELLPYFKTLRQKTTFYTPAYMDYTYPGENFYVRNRGRSTFSTRAKSIHYKDTLKTYKGQRLTQTTEMPYLAGYKERTTGYTYEPVYGGQKVKDNQISKVMRNLGLDMEDLGGGRANSIYRIMGRIFAAQKEKKLTETQIGAQMYSLFETRAGMIPEMLSQDISGIGEIDIQKYGDEFKAATIEVEKIVKESYRDQEMMASELKKVRTLHAQNMLSSMGQALFYGYVYDKAAAKKVLEDQAKSMADTVSGSWDILKGSLQQSGIKFMNLILGIGDDREKPKMDSAVSNILKSITQTVNDKIITPLSRPSTFAKVEQIMKGLYNAFVSIGESAYNAFNVIKDVVSSIISPFKFLLGATGNLADNIKTVGNVIGMVLGSKLLGKFTRGLVREIDNVRYHTFGKYNQKIIETQKRMQLLSGQKDKTARNFQQFGKIVDKNGTGSLNRFGNTAQRTGKKSMGDFRPFDLRNIRTAPVSANVVSYNPLSDEYFLGQRQAYLGKRNMGYGEYGSKFLTQQISRASIENYRNTPLKINKILSKSIGNISRSGEKQLLAKISRGNLKRLVSVMPRTPEMADNVNKIMTSPLNLQKWMLKNKGIKTSFENYNQMLKTLNSATKQNATIGKPIQDLLATREQLATQVNKMANKYRVRMGSEAKNVWSISAKTPTRQYDFRTPSKDRALLNTQASMGALSMRGQMYGVTMKAGDYAHHTNLKIKKAYSMVEKDGKMVRQSLGYQLKDTKTGMETFVSRYSKTTGAIDKTYTEINKILRSSKSIAEKTAALNSVVGQTAPFKQIKGGASLLPTYAGGIVGTDPYNYIKMVDRANQSLYKITSPTGIEKTLTQQDLKSAMPMRQGLMKGFISMIRGRGFGAGKEQAFISQMTKAEKLGYMSPGLTRAFGIAMGDKSSFRGYYRNLKTEWSQQRAAGFSPNLLRRGVDVGSFLRQPGKLLGSGGAFSNMWAMYGPMLKIGAIFKLIGGGIDSVVKYGLKGALPGLASDFMNTIGSFVGIFSKTLGDTIKEGAYYFEKLAESIRDDISMDYAYERRTSEERTMISTKVAETTDKFFSMIQDSIDQYKEQLPNDLPSQIKDRALFDFGNMSLFGTEQQRKEFKDMISNPEKGILAKYRGVDFEGKVTGYTGATGAKKLEDLLLSGKLSPQTLAGIVERLSMGTIDYAAELLPEKDRLQYMSIFEKNLAVVDKKATANRLTISTLTDSYNRYLDIYKDIIETRTGLKFDTDIVLKPENVPTRDTINIMKDLKKGYEFLIIDKDKMDIGSVLRQSTTIIDSTKKRMTTLREIIKDLNSELTSVGYSMQTSSYRQALESDLTNLPRLYKQAQMINKAAKEAKELKLTQEMTNILQKGVPKGMSMYEFAQATTEKFLRLSGTLEVDIKPEMNKILGNIPALVSDITTDLQAQFDKISMDQKITLGVPLSFDIIGKMLKVGKTDKEIKDVYNKLADFYKKNKKADYLFNLLYGDTGKDKVGTPSEIRSRFTNILKGDEDFLKKYQSKNKGVFKTVDDLKKAINEAEETGVTFDFMGYDQDKDIISYLNNTYSNIYNVITEWEQKILVAKNQVYASLFGGNIDKMGIEPLMKSYKSSLGFTPTLSFGDDVTDELTGFTKIESPFLQGFTDPFGLMRGGVGMSPTGIGFGGVDKTQKMLTFTQTKGEKTPDIPLPGNIAEASSAFESVMNYVNNAKASMDAFTQTKLDINYQPDKFKQATTDSNNLSTAIQKLRDISSNPITLQVYTEFLNTYTDLTPKPANTPAVTTNTKGVVKGSHSMGVSFIGSTGLYKLHGGEAVFPSWKTAKFIKDTSGNNDDKFVDKSYNTFEGKQSRGSVAINVYASPGMNEERLAQLVAEKVAALEGRINQQMANFEDTRNHKERRTNFFNNKTAKRFSTLPEFISAT